MESIKVRQLSIREETSIFAGANDAHQSHSRGLPPSADHSSLTPNKSIRWDVCHYGICVFLLLSFKESVFFQFSSADGMPDGPASLSDSTFPPRHGCDDDPFAPFTRERLLFFSPFFFFHVGEIGGGLQEVAVTMLRSW